MRSTNLPEYARLPASDALPDHAAGQRRVIIAGAGIGGLTVALALAQRQIPSVMLETAPRLEEIGAGVQLSPNASRILIALGLHRPLAPHVVAPEALRVMNARSGKQITALTLGAAADRRYGAPFWVVHRGDLQRVLLDAVHGQPLINLRLGTTVAGHLLQENGVGVAGMWRDLRIQENGRALIGADGLHSQTRQSLGLAARTQHAGRSAWRATVMANALPEHWARQDTHIWLGGGNHLVHYPVHGGRMINLVAIVGDDAEHAGWNEAAGTDALLARLSGWSRDIRGVIEAAPEWRVWSLYETPALDRWGAGPITLLGDAAHAMLPYIAQGAAMAIEDAWALAASLAREPEDCATAFRAYEQQRRERTKRVTQAARRTGFIYGLRGPAGALRNAVTRVMGDERLRGRYDWIYEWGREDAELRLA